MEDAPDYRHYNYFPRRKIVDYHYYPADRTLDRKNGDYELYLECGHFFWRLEVNVRKNGWHKESGCYECWKAMGSPKTKADRDKAFAKYERKPPSCPEP